MEKILLTGGAGFIGNLIVERLYHQNKYEIDVYDNFSKQIHGDNYKESYLYNNINAILFMVISVVALT
jgi:dTDP-L-rhamnose 4-epimerase